MQLCHSDLQLLDGTLQVCTAADLLILLQQTIHLLFQLLDVVVVAHTDTQEILHSHLQLLNVLFTCACRRRRRRRRRRRFDLDVLDHLASHASDLGAQLERVERSGDGDHLALVVVGDRPYSLLISSSLELAEDLADLSVTPPAIEVNIYNHRAGLC
jgi:hypothetical protein